MRSAWTISDQRRREFGDDGTVVVSPRSGHGGCGRPTHGHLRTGRPRRPRLPWEVESPDKSWVAFRRDGNIWVRSRDGKQEFASPRTPNHHLEYGGMADATGGRALMRVLGLPPCSPCSGHRIRPGYWPSASTSVPCPSWCWSNRRPPGGGRPVEHRTRYTMPGEQAQAMLTWNVLHVAERTVVRQAEPTVIMHGTADHVRLVDRHIGGRGALPEPFRDARRLELRRLDPTTGAVTTLISESGETRVDPTPQLGEPTMTQVLDSGEIVVVVTTRWLGPSLSSIRQTDNRSGRSPPGERRCEGALGRRTSPAGVVRRCRPRRRRSYVPQIRRIGLDGQGFVRLTEDDTLDHDAVSPDGGDYFVQRASSPIRPPHTVVRDGDGQLLVELEAPTASALEEQGWSAPSGSAPWLPTAGPASTDCCGVHTVSTHSAATL